MAEEPPKAPEVHKSKSFKRIRGFLRGDKKKSKKEKKAESTKRTKSDEESTVYGVDVDERSVASRKSADSSKQGAGGGALDAKKKSFLLKVVLLLMDPETRRFELLQLEFDSLKALVSDVLAQIPVSVTEEALRKQTYTGICGRDGKAMPASKLLADFCKGNEVLVAIPTGVVSKECARLARPILSDDKVVSMLASSGIDATSWRDEAMKKKKSKKSEDKESASRSTRNAAESSGGSGVAGALKTAFLIALVAAVLQVFHLYISAPIKPGNVVSPGVWLSKCGLLFFLPSCENAYFSLDKNGKATYSDASQTTVWLMEGGVCDESDESCTPGMVVGVDGNIVIGGKNVKQATTYVKGFDMDQWPFAELPNLKLKKKNAPQ